MPFYTDSTLLSRFVKDKQFLSLYVWGGIKLHFQAKGYKNSYLE